MDVNHLQAKATSWVNDNHNTPNINWSGQNSECLTYQGQTVQVADLGPGLKAEIEGCHKLISQLVGNHNFLSNLPEKLHDNFSITRMNYSPFDSQESTVPMFFAKVLAHQKKPITTPEGEFNIEVIEDIVDVIGQLNAKLFLLTYFTGAITIRGTEISAFRARNTSEPRNFYIEDTKEGLQCFIIQDYSKTSNRQGKQEARVHFPAPEVQKLLIIFLYCIRPAEVIMVQKLLSTVHSDVTSR